MRRVLVTGASGFIGRHVLEPLAARGFEVCAVSSRPAPPRSGEVWWKQADLLDESSVAALVSDVRPSHLLHLAWFAKPGEYASSPSNVAWVRASLHLLERFAEAGGHRIVGAGTCFEYDWQYGFCRELTTPTRPDTIYGACKDALRTTMLAFSKEVDVSGAWGRIFFLYGPHEHPARLVASVARALLESREAPCSPGTQVRDFLHVQDVADAFAHLLDSPVTGPVNIASGEPVAVKEVVGLVGKASERADLVRLGALSARENEPPLLVADVGRLRDEVGFHPRFDLRSGLSETVRWWRGHLGVPPLETSRRGPRVVASGEPDG